MKKYILFLFIAALFAACTPQNEAGTPFKAGQEVTLTAHVPSTANSGTQQLPCKQRISGKDVGMQIDLTWDIDDQIKVTIGDKSATFTLVSGAGSTQAMFTGVMPADGSSYSAQYPVEEPDLSMQTYAENGFSKGLMKMVADNGTIENGFVLKAQHALLGLQLTGSDVLGKIVLTNPADSKTYTLDCSDVTLTDEATLFYIVVPAGEWANGFAVDVYADDNTTIIKTLTKTGSATFSATEAMVMPVQNIDSETTTDKKKVDLVMFMGQSNMAGRGVASESVVVTEGHGYEFRAISDPTKLYPVVEPFGVNENNPTSGVSEKSKTGSLVSAFIEGHYKYRQVPIVGVSCSVGGTATSFWVPNKNPLNDAIARHDSAKVWLEKNGYTIEHDYMVWLQGEADGKNGVSSEQYASNLTAIIEEMIAKTGIEFCAIIRVGHCKTDLTRNRDIIYSQTNLCKTYDKAVMISTMLAGCLGDQMKDASHYTQSTYNTVGLDAGKHAAYYINTGTQPAMYDPEYDNYFPYSEIKRKWLITTQVDYGAIYTGPQQVIDNEAYVATITLMAGYAFDNYSISMGNTKITPVIDNCKMTISIANVTEDIEIVVKTTNENSGEANDTLFNFDFTKHTLDDYVLDGTFTVPSNSNLSTIMYDNLLGANFNGNLPNGLIITNPIDASKAWTLEFVASFAQPSDLAGNRRAFLSGDNLTPFIFINGGTVSTLSFQISGPIKKTLSLFLS